MDKDFMQSAPVGTKIFNQHDNDHYIKVERNGVQFWRRQKGTRLGGMLYGNTKRDAVGERYEYRDKDGTLQTGQRGDNIPDYLQTPGFVNSSKYFQKNKNDIIVKNGKFFTVDGKEIPKHKLDKKHVYHIEGGSTDTGKLLKNQLNRSEKFYKWEKLNENLLHRESLINQKAALLKANKTNLSAKAGRELVDIENKLKRQGITNFKVTPFEKTNRNILNIPADSTVKQGSIFDVSQNNQNNSGAVSNTNNEFNINNEVAQIASTNLKGVLNNGKEKTNNNNNSNSNEVKPNDKVQQHRFSWEKDLNPKEAKKLDNIRKVFGDYRNELNINKKTKGSEANRSRLTGPMNQHTAEMLGLL